jgi:spore coat polysaccharide biosynthesis protein SpsF
MEDLGHLRTTVDTLSDYLTMAKLFEEVSDPVAVPWRHLVMRCAALAVAKRPAGLILGTAQLGQPYGITRDAGLMPIEMTETILGSVAELGVMALDTARAYGDSEARIGAFAARNPGLPKVITKLAPFDTDESDPICLSRKTVASVDESCAALGVDSLDCLLLHRAQHIEVECGVVWDTLLALQTEGRIKTLGVSVQSPKELIKVLN